MVKAYGSNRAKRLQIVLAALNAAPKLSVFAPPYSPPHRCHELIGNLMGSLTLDLGRIDCCSNRPMIRYLSGPKAGLIGLR